MLTSQKVIDAINEQIGYEFSAELQYYAIAAHFAAEALPQLSQHFFRQAEEEKGHALRFIKYVVDAGGRVMIPAIDAPKSKFKTARDAVKLSLDQEIHVTQQINGLVELARKENDYITINFLQWFLTEQLEEVSSMDNLLKIIERAGTVFTAGAETYQITGTVVEATGSKVTVEKGTERFEFDIDPATMKGSAELKVGSTVTVTYVMSATKIEAASQAPSPRSSP